MTPQEFFTKYNGKGIDFDGAYGPQCMDLMNQFVVEVFGDTSGQLRAPTAYQSWLKNSPDYEKIHYQPGRTPQEGDVVYWSDTYIKGTGHVAVATNKANQSVFTSSDQNWPVGSLCHYQEHTYNGVVGWKRRKRQQQNNQESNQENNEEDDMQKRKRVHERYTLHTIMDDDRDGSLKTFAMKRNEDKAFWIIDPSDIMEVVTLFSGEFFRINRKDLKEDKGTLKLGDFYRNYPEVLLPEGTEYKY